MSGTSSSIRISTSGGLERKKKAKSKSSAASSSSTTATTKRKSKVGSKKSISADPQLTPLVAVEQKGGTKVSKLKTSKTTTTTTSDKSKRRTVNITSKTTRKKTAMKKKSSSASSSASSSSSSFSSWFRRQKRQHAQRQPKPRKPISCCWILFMFLVGFTLVKYAGFLSLLWERRESLYWNRLDPSELLQESKFWKDPVMNLVPHLPIQQVVHAWEEAAILRRFPHRSTPKEEHRSTTAKSVHHNKAYRENATARRARLRGVIQQRANKTASTKDEQEWP